MNIEQEILEIKSILRTVALENMEYQAQLKKKNRWNRLAFDKRKYTNEKRQLLILEFDEFMDYIDGLRELCADKKTNDEEIASLFSEIAKEIENRVASIYESMAELRDSLHE